MMNESRDEIMGSTQNIPLEPSSQSEPRRGRFSHWGLAAALFCSMAIGMVALAVIQSRSQAQSPFNQPLGFAPQVPIQTRIPPTAPASSTENDPNQLPSPALAETDSSNNVPSNVRIVYETFMESVTEPGGNTYMVPKMRRRAVPIYGHDATQGSAPSDSDLMQLGSQYPSANQARRESINQELTEKLTEIFDARHKEQVARAEKLRAELKQTQELIDKRVELKSKIIERRVKELTGQQDELSWNPQAANSYYFNGSSYGNMSPSALSLPLTQPSPAFVQPAMVPTSPTLPASDLSPPTDLPPTIPNLSVPRMTIPRSIEENPAVVAPNALVPPNPEATPSIPFSNGMEKDLQVDSQRSYMSVGLKLKKLIRDLNRARETLGAKHPTLTTLEDAFEETKSLWDFERQALLTELESIESEMTIVGKQLSLARDKANRQKERSTQGAGSVSESAEAELGVLTPQREMLQLENKVRTTRNALDWMASFEQKFLKPSAPKPEPAVY